MSRIHFRVEPFDVVVSSHGWFMVTADDVPVGVPQLGDIHSGPCDLLNETWKPLRRRPKKIQPFDDGMPNLEDPRLKQCVTEYVEKHRDRLRRNHDEMREKWRQLQSVPMTVNDITVYPGQRVKLFLALDGVREHAELKMETVFYAVAPNHDEGQPFLYLKDYRAGLACVHKYKWRHWVEPIES